MFRFGLVLVSLTVFVTVISGVKEFKPCATASTDCLKSLLTDLITKHYQGTTSLNIIKFDPLDLKSLSLPKVSGSPVSIDLKFKNASLTGLSGVVPGQVKTLTKDKSKPIFEIDVTAPKLVVEGPYSVDGQVLLLPINGEGKSKITFEKISGKIKVKCEKIEKKGVTYLNIVKTHLDLEPQKTEFFFDNLFKGDKTLGDNMNRFLNENWKEIYGELKPVIMEAIGEILKSTVNGMFAKVPYGDIFIES